MFWLVMLIPAWLPPPPGLKPQARSVAHNGQKPPSSTAPITVHQIPHFSFSAFIKKKPPYINQPQGVNRDISSPNGYMDIITSIP